MNQENKKNLICAPPAKAEIAPPEEATTAFPTAKVSTGDKKLSVIETVLICGLFAVVICVTVLSIFSATVLNHRDQGVFGYKVFTVLSNSMKATHFEAGDIVFSKEMDPSMLNEGDMISFVSENLVSSGDVVTHKIRKINIDATGRRTFVTYGTTTGKDDETEVTEERILGKYVFSLPKLGSFFRFFKSMNGYIVCILIPFLILILYQGIRGSIAFRRYKKEQMAELQAEKQQIAEGSGAI